MTRETDALKATGAEGNEGCNGYGGSECARLMQLS